MHNREGIIERLIEVGISPINIITDYPMKHVTTFKAGGPAELFIEPDNIAELINIMKLLKNENIKALIIGKGSNMLVSDKGIPGVVIRIAEKISSISIAGNEVIAECGCLLSVLGKQVAKEGFTGIEFASGIPGTLGGGVVMNAGAYDGELKDYIKWVEVLDENLEVVRLTNSEMEFSYRKSLVEKKGYIAIRACFSLEREDQELIDFKMRDFADRRRKKQPLTLPSAGSTFKRPEGFFAGKLIEDAGLKGYRIGGASVSELHCGFVVNDLDGTANDIYRLIKHIEKRVFENSGVKLQLEVKLIGDFLERD